jgi:predicted metal-dependent HD superfamily phosphohydrolase
MICIERWRAVWNLLGIEPALYMPEHLFAELIACYSESHRQYHNLTHLKECLLQFDQACFLAEHPAEVEIAIWFHDAIYNTRRSNNEEKSALWARDCLAAANVDAAVAKRVYSFILATRHDVIPQVMDACLLVDIDLSILGANPDHFDEYEYQIRQEYAWVPDCLFCRKRRALLQGFLARARIFNTTYFVERYEKQARLNLNRSLDKLMLAVNL